MVEIRAVLRATRRRLRVQGAIDGLVLAIGPAFPFGFAAIEAGRDDLLAVIAGCVALIVLAIALRPRSDVAIAAQIDRTHEHADRIRTALALARRAEADPIAAGLVHAAVQDGITAARRSDPRRAVRYRFPEGVVVAFGLVNATVALALLVPHPPGLRLHWGVTDDGPVADGEYSTLDLDFIHDRLRQARAENPAAAGITCALDASLEQLAEDRLDKQQLLVLARESKRALDELPGTAGALDDSFEAIERLARAPKPSPPPPGVPGPEHLPDPSGWDNSVHSELPATRPNEMPTKDVGLAGDRGASRREIVLSAAQHGFAGEPYLKVWGQYQRANEQTIHAEALPSSYRYVVERYFYLIRPSECPESASLR